MSVLKNRWIIVIAALFLVGCASSRSGKVYTRDQARTSHSVYFGTVLAVAPVQIEGTKSGIGTVVGGAAGGVAGSTIGSGSGSTLAAVGGALLGMAAGSAIEEQTTKSEGLEITVELDSGEIIAVIQEKDDVYAVGDRVRILRGRDGSTRVRQ